MAIQDTNFMGASLKQASDDFKLLPLPVLQQYMSNPTAVSADGVTFGLLAGAELARRKRLQDSTMASQQPDPTRIPTIAESLVSGAPMGQPGVPVAKAGIAAFAQQPQQAQQQPQQITLSQPRQATPINIAAPYASPKTPLQQQASYAPSAPKRMAHGGIVALNGEDESYIRRTNREAHERGVRESDPELAAIKDIDERNKRRLEKYGPPPPPISESLLGGLKYMGATAKDALSYPVRAVAAAAEKYLPIPAIPESFFGGDRSSMTPYLDQLRKEEARPTPVSGGQYVPYPETAGMRYPTSTSIPTPTAVTNAAKTSATKEGFIQEVLPLANEAAQRLNVPVQAVLGQWAAETGWGKSTIPGTYNLGNIKADPNWKGPSVMAVDNQTRQREPYRAYGSPEEAAADFTRLLETGRYKNVPGATTPKDYFSALKKAGYATDKDYEAKSLGVTRDVESVLSALGIQGGQGVQSGVASLLQGPPMTASANPAMARMSSTTPTATAASVPVTPDTTTAPGLPSLRETPEMKEAFANIGTMPSFSAEDAEKARKLAQERYRSAVDPRMAEIRRLQEEQSRIGSERDSGAFGRALMEAGLRGLEASSRPGSAAYALGVAGRAGLGAYEKEQATILDRAVKANQLKIALEKDLMKQGLDEVTASNLAEKEARKITEDTAEARSKMGLRQAQAISGSTTAQASLERAQNQLIIAQSRLEEAIRAKASAEKIRELEVNVKQEQQRVRELAEARASIAEQRKTLQAEAKTLEGDFRPEARARLTGIRAQLAALGSDSGAQKTIDFSAIKQ